MIPLVFCSSRRIGRPALWLLKPAGLIATDSENGWNVSFVSVQQRGSLQKDMEDSVALIFYSQNFFVLGSEATIKGSQMFA